MSPFDAALKGSREIGFTIIAISISLVAVFIPVLLMGGVIGKIFNEFAVVVTVSILASTFVSLTLTPMLAARMPAPKHQDGNRGIGAWLERGFDAVLRAYGRALKLCFRFHIVVFARVSRHGGAAPSTSSTPSPRASSRSRISASCRCRRWRARTFPSTP